MTDLEPVPESLLKFIQCKCKLSTANPCGSNTCSCRKHGLKCITVCSDCRVKVAEMLQKLFTTIMTIILFQNSCNSNALFCFYNHLSFIVTQQKYT